MRLDELQTGQKAKIVKILGHGAFRKRLIEMGFVKGHDIEVLLHAPLKDPIKYSIMGYEISLRRSEAHLVEVTPFAGEQNHARSGGEKPADVRHRPAHVINVALVGNPNCGKTSLFNVASGAKEHVGNYSGVTVDAKSGHFDYKGYRFNIVDLPGTYSLASYSPEELYVRKYLRDATPDVIINVVVASNLERNLYLTTELIDMDRSMVIALNMYDELEKRGDRLDYKLLGSMIGVPVVPTVSRTGQGLNELFDTVIDVYEGRDEDVRHVHVNLGEDIERGVTAVKDLIKAEPDVSPRFSPRFIAIKLLEDDAEVIRLVESLPGSAQIMEATRAEQQRIELMRKEDASSAIADEKYGFIAGALAETLVKGDQDRNNPTNIIDAFVTNKLFGFPIFLLIMFAIFWATFEIGQYPMDWIEWLVGKISQIVQGMMPDGPLKDLIADGIIGGVGGVIVFLPNILILYFCISFMEDSGYMARAAFIMDKLMHRIGLHGKSFIPLIMGFGCTVPSIMATRSIESRTSRLITILINPFMSCSARLPVYVLLVGTFFERHAALVILGLYCLGVVVAMVTARLLRKFKFTTDVTPFVMELPPYRIPTLKASLRHTWGKGQQYLKKMGGVILVASIIVWALNYFPIHDRQATVADADDAQLTTAISDDSQIDVHRDSYLEMAGKIVNPVMEPLGFHWRASVAALAGIPAKEIVVSTLGVLYTGDEEIDDSSLSARLTAVNPATGTADFSAASALSFMIFILLYCPCIATVAAIVKETNSWKYGAFSVVYNTLLAWLVALAAYHIALPFC
ncbi:ferrous iron transport protein B [Paramuribaculum intestinale]|jgi:ferrous iron transport protein B|uniref:Ferrous iron transport protein B n=1 Tax=Paramuribaculum intestinale TaxID=2094151 RepID=A0A2V1IVK7_9BACT|nr:ferrous iron transport protein B [Paramuribaculum intestinale]ROS94577.1 ferrous iron transport protein B [Muribaculaceae bacterium Isolate-043 (Harlan)]ROT16699.1 ferrous iron transport protein B [Muribaculaceae bacterium Isolate-105 (HZI)]RXE62661.1 ferrous iron transport protein B [Muribaculaceae bacterium Isolate-004 (NCI)]MCX4330015.1 ferrous iron transport protein B [Paramuribaculum intestinale]PWB07364.1 ferrous iron transport protein B [Paramuribaculum intestinale]